MTRSEIIALGCALFGFAALVAAALSKESCQPATVLICSPWIESGGELNGKPIYSRHCAPQSEADEQRDLAPEALRGEPMVSPLTGKARP